MLSLLEMTSDRRFSSFLNDLSDQNGCGGSRTTPPDCPRHPAALFLRETEQIPSDIDEVDLTFIDHFFRPPSAAMRELLPLVPPLIIFKISEYLVLLS